MNKLILSLAAFVTLTIHADEISATTVPTAVDLTREWNLTLNELHADREAYYPFHGDLLDYSGKERHATNSESTNITYGIDHNGVANAAAIFTGDTCYALHWKGWYVTNNLTIAAWVRSSTNLVSTGYAVFPVHGGDQVGVGFRYGTNGIAVVEHRGGSLASVLDYNSDLGDGWHHVTITVMDSGAPDLYVDGRFVAAGKNSGYVKRIDHGCSIGGGAYGSFRGLMSDVVFYSKALTDREIRALYRATTDELCAEDKPDVIATSKSESISYGSFWESDSDDAVAEIAIEGTVVNSANGNGEYEWTPPRNGTYTFTHTVKTNGVQVGETLTATFEAVGFNPETPMINPASGTSFDSSLSISMTCASEGATIHYTTNGVTPTMESPVFKRFKIYGKTTVKAIAFYEDGTASEMAVAEYAQGTCEDPMISLADGTTFYHANQAVSISMSGEGTLRYTLDGSDPTAESTVYEGPFTISDTTTIKAKVFSDRYFDSRVVTATLTREWEPVVAPTNTLRVANSGLSVYVDLGCEDGASELHYTLDGSDPTAESPIYTKPFYAFDADTLKVVAVRDDYANSTVITNDLAIYCVVDLSEGESASSYPVSYRVGIPEDGWTDEYKTTKLVLRKINAGSFIMGDDQTNEANRVTIAKPFYMGVFEMTQKQYSLVTGSSPAHFTGDALPVEMVSYDMIRGNNIGALYPDSTEVDASSLMGKMRARTGLCFDLPTDSQWEYACRSGTTTTYCYGDVADGAYMWYKGNADSQTHAVGTKLPNVWGLYDMYGNASEWCLDWYPDHVGERRVLRGGCWAYGESVCSSSYRYSTKPTDADYSFGFRLCRTMDTPQAPSITPDSGSTFSASLSVSMTSDLEDVTIHYTTNGVTPTMESPVFKRFKIYGKTTVRAIAFYEDGTASEMAVADYALGTCEDPVISLTDGTVFYHSNQEVSIMKSEEGTLRYTLDGSEPTAESPVYEGPFMISDTTTIKAKVFSDRYFDSQVVTATLTREWEQVATPVIAAVATFSGSKTTVSISCATEDATIRYTTDGSDPDSSSSVYTGSFVVTNSCTIKAYAVREDYTDSSKVSWTIEKVWCIGDALNSPDLVFTTSGDSGWVSDTSNAYDKVECMRSGPIGNSEQSILSGSVTGKGTLTFWWRTSCEQVDDYEWDHAEFVTEGVTNKLNDICEWQQVSYTYTTEGEHTFYWAYIKDYDWKDGEDCAWVDQVTWAPESSDPIPEIGSAATKEEIAAVLSGSADGRLASNLTNVTQYTAYRAWVNRVAGTEKASRQAIKDSPQAWLSYALDCDTLLTKVPVQGEMKIAAFEKNASTGTFDFSVSIDGVTVGTGATAENLATLFGIEGCSSVDGTYSAENVTFTFGTPVDGKVKISAAPTDTTASQFFLKVKMTP